MKKYIIIIAVLMALSGTACAAELTNPGIIHSGEVFTISNGDNLTILGDPTYESLSIEAGGFLIIESGGNLITGGYIYNFGNISNHGIMYNNGSQIWNDGNIENYGTIYNNGSLGFIPSGNIVNYGLIYLGPMGDISVGNNIYNHGNISHHGGMFEVAGICENYGNIDVYNGCFVITQGATVNNQGNINIQFCQFDHVEGGILSGNPINIGSEVELLIQPVADIGGPYTGVVNEGISFDASGSYTECNYLGYTNNRTITGYTWLFGDGTTATGISPTHTYSSEGTYTVHLLVIDSAGFMGTDEIQVTCATELTTPGIIHSGEVFTISNGDNFTLRDDDNNQFTVDLLIEAGGSLVIESGSNFTLNHGSIVNEGSINNSGTINGWGTFRNNGTFNNYGNIINVHYDNYGIFYNEGYFYFYNNIENHGTIENSGYIFNEGSLTNFGNFYNSGITGSYGLINNYGNIYNSGTLSQGMGYSIDNYGTINSSGLIYLGLDCDVDNFGTIDTSGKIYSYFGDIRNAGTIDNTGTITSHLGMIGNEGTINNSGTLSGNDYFEWGACFITNNGTINNCITGVVIGSMKGNSMNTVTCTGEEEAPITIYYLTEEDANEAYGLDITATVKTYSDSIVIELLKPMDFFGNINTVQLNLDPECILSVESDNSDVDWSVNGDNEKENTGFGSMLTVIERASGDQETVREITINLDENCEWDGVFSKNEDGYGMVMHVTRLLQERWESPESIWLGCDEKDDNGNNQEIPEFPTLALPVVAILGLAFIFQRRKE